MNFAPKDDYYWNIEPNDHLILTMDHQTRLDKYPAKAHARRVANELVNMPDVSATLLILQAAPTSNYPDSDMPAPFRQDRYFYYMTGCSEPDCYCTYDIKTDTLTLWLPQIKYDRLIWTGRGSTIEEAMSAYDIDEAKYYIPSTASTDTNPTSSPVLTQNHFPLDIHHLTPSTSTLTPLKIAINTTRTYKDTHEIFLIRHANHITARAHLSVMQSLSHITSEAQVEATYTATCISHAARTQAYMPIAGSGANASVLHYTANSAPFGDAEALVLDAGCEWLGYASDVTRSLPINGSEPGVWGSEESKGVYAAVERMQEVCLAALGPGVRFWELYSRAMEVGVEALVGWGILRGDVGKLVEEGWGRLFFMHGLGHHLGLEVHDVSAGPLVVPPGRKRGVWSHFNGDEVNGFAEPCTPRAGVLEPDMVVTVEPGLYFNRQFIEMALEKRGAEAERVMNREVLERYYRVGGVRIEDDVLITKDGYRNLTLEAGAVKGKEMLKVIREGARKE